MSELLPVVESDDCVCGAMPSEPHPCPFGWEIHEDDTLCNCCESCSDECAMAI